jgi:chromosome partitioning protein
VKTLVLANQKGGVGKSAVACQLAFYFAQEGQRVMLLDLDHQMNASKPLSQNARVTVAAFSASDLLDGDTCTVPQATFVLVRGDERLSSLERQSDNHNAFVNSLRSFLDAADGDFDVCVIDTNPNPDIRYAAALITADFLLSPIELNQEAIDGIGALLHHKRYGFYKIKQVLNAKLELLGILPNLVEATPFQKENFAQLAASYSPLLIALPGSSGAPFAFIPTRTAIAEAQAAGVPLWLLRQAVPEGQTTLPDAMPIRSAARDAWKVVKPAFDEIAVRMGLNLGAKV